MNSPEPAPSSQPQQGQEIPKGQLDMLGFEGEKMITWEEIKDRPRDPEGINWSNREQLEAGISMLQDYLAKKRLVSVDELLDIRKGIGYCKDEMVPPLFKDEFNEIYRNTQRIAYSFELSDRQKMEAYLELFTPYLARVPQEKHGESK
jgi:hypothetical protein